MFEKRKRNISITEGATSAIESLRQLLEVLHGARICFRELDIDPIFEDDSANRTFVICGKFFWKGDPMIRENDPPVIDVCIELHIQKIKGKWIPNRASIMLDYERKDYRAVWKMYPAQGLAVKVYPTDHRADAACNEGTSDVDRWVTSI